MAKPIRLIVRYEESRSWEYQSAKIGAEIELELDEGENAASVFATYQTALRDRVTTRTAEEVERLVADKRERGWK